MSIKRKLATSLATAGLLAGIFGSALAPVAQAAGVKGSALRDALKTTLYGGYRNDASNHSGTAADPYVMYAPLVNDGTSVDSIGYDVSADDPVCMYADESDFVTTGNVPLHDDGDEIPVKVSATNGLGIFFYDTNDASGFGSGYQYSEAYWTTGSKSIDDVDGGINLCFAPMDDDDAYTSTVTITVRGQVAWKFTIVVVGPATSIMPSSYIGGWVAESNDAIHYAGQLTFKDKAGSSLRYYFYTLGPASSSEWLTDALDFAKTGYSSDFGDNTLEFYVDDTSTGDAASDMAGSDGDRYFYLSDSFCGEMGETHTVLAAVDIDGSGTLTNADLKSGTWSYKCSADGSEATWTQLGFDAASVEAGELVSGYLYADDGYGHPQGTGSSFSQHIYCSDSGVEASVDDEDVTCVRFYPNEINHTGDQDGLKYLAADLGMNDFSGNDISEAMIYDNPIQDGVYEVEDATYGTYTGIRFVLADGKLPLVYRASALYTGVASVRIPFYSIATTSVYGGAKTLKASISVVAATQGSDTAQFGTTIKVGKRTVSITGPVGAKVTFVVEDAKMNVKTYYRVVGADGKAALRFRVKGAFKVTALLGDMISNTVFIRPKF